MDDESRRALRNLARRAEWSGRPGPAGAAQDARTLRDLGREIELALTQAREPDPDRGTWAHRASERLAAYCQRARPDWTVEQIAELSRLREDAMTALAPGPGEPQTDEDEDPKPARRTLSAALTGALGSRRRAVLALAAVSCLVLVALVLTLPPLLSNNTAQTPAASATTTIPTTPTLTTSLPGTPTTSMSASATASAPASASASATSSTTSASGPDSTVTAIQINNTDDLSGDPPEVIVTFTVAASGTGNIAINVSVTGNSGQPQVVQQLTESDDTSYVDLTQQVDLDQWCGQSSVLVTVSSGRVSQSSKVAVSGC